MKNEDKALTVKTFKALFKIKLNVNQRVINVFMDYNIYITFHSNLFRGLSKL